MGYSVPKTWTLKINGKSMCSFLYVNATFILRFV